MTVREHAESLVGLFKRARTPRFKRAVQLEMVEVYSTAAPERLKAYSIMAYNNTHGFTNEYRTLMIEELV